MKRLEIRSEDTWVDQFQIYQRQSRYHCAELLMPTFLRNIERTVQNT